MDRRQKVFENLAKDQEKIFDYAGKQGYFLKLSKFYKVDNSMVLMFDVGNGSVEICNDLGNFWVGLNKTKRHSHSRNSHVHNFNGKAFSVQVDWVKFDS